MSRCFPFPPPGYEKKDRTEDTDLLTKEKRKEKKHKKDKKDKEKKHKDRSKDKHRDKKDQKEKQKDKNDRDGKGKEKSRDAKKIEGQPECYNGEKIGPTSVQNNVDRDSKYVLDLARRIMDEDRAMGSQNGPVTDQRRSELQGKMVGCTTDNPLEEREKVNDKKEYNRTINGKRNHVEAKGLGIAIIQKKSGMDQKEFQGVVEKNGITKQMDDKEKKKHKQSESKDDQHKDRDREKKSKSKDKDRDKKKKKGEKEKEKEIKEPSKTQFKLKDNNPKLEGNGRNSNLNSCNNNPLDVLKTSCNSRIGEGNLGKNSLSACTDVLKKSGSNCPIGERNLDKNFLNSCNNRPAGEGNVGKKFRNSCSKPSDVLKKSSSNGPFGDRNLDKEFLSTCNVKPQDILKTSNNPPVGEGTIGKSILNSSNITDVLKKTSSNNPHGEGSLGKRKEFQINGILHGNGIQPNKLPRLVSSTHPIMENGRKLEPRQSANHLASELLGEVKKRKVDVKEHFASELQGAVKKQKADVKEHKINGMEVSQPIICPTKPLSSIAQVSKNGEPSTKPPHPDSKYLDEILSVPKMEDLSDVDDQEWLFSSNTEQSKKLKVGFPGVDDEIQQVWAEALQIQFADVTALPYVIPY